MALQAVKLTALEEELPTNWRNEPLKAVLPKDQGDGMYHSLHTEISDRDILA